MNVYKTKGVCCSRIKFDIQDGILRNVEFENGCDGNLKALCNLAEGMPVDEVIKRLRGIDCDGKGTSCPDQLAKALEAAIEDKASDRAV